MVWAWLTLLGGFEARVAGTPAVPLPPKVQALLARLACRPGQAHPRDKLAALLWPDAPAPRARHSLRQALTTVRQSFPASEPPLLLERGDSIALNPAAVEVDADQFEQLLAGGAPGMRARAAALYRGDLLEGIAAQDAPFEEWLVTERERLKELALEALGQLLAEDAGKGRLDEAIRTAGRLLALDPVQEPVHRALMRLYASQGRRGAALRQYQVCTAALKRELGIEPEPQTRELYRGLLLSSGARVDGAGAGREASGPPAVPVPATGLVGRQAELGRLAEARRQAWLGHGRLVAVLGEAGIGKTRLVEALVHDTLEQGGRVLVGRSYESSQSLPFGPWLDALRAAGVTDEIARDPRMGGPFRPQLARLLPQLASGDPGAGVGPEDRLQLFEAMVHVLERMAASQPVVVVLEDLHWADELSTRLLAFFAHRLASGRILAVFTARDEELRAAGSGLRQLCAELDREAHVTRLALGPLSRDETVALTGTLARVGREAVTAARLGERIWQASAGNPFVAVETIRAVDAAGEPAAGVPLPLPARVRDTIVARFDQLAGRSRELASAASVIGRAFSFALVQRAAGLDPHEAAEAVEELVAARILHVVDEQLDFSHERIREVAYAQLLPPRRALLHAAVARAIEALHAGRLDEVADRLAYHYARTDLDAEAIEHLARFADRAAQAYAHAEAVEALREALVRARRLPACDLDQRVLSLVARQALSLTVLGQFRETLDLLLPERERAERVADRALASAYFFRLGLTYSYLAQLDEATGHGVRALAEADGCGDRTGAGKAHYLLALAAYYTGASADGIEHARRAIAHLEQGRSRSDLGWLGLSHWVLGLHLLVRGEFGAALAAEAAVEAVADRLNGEPRLASFAAWTAGWILATEGRFDDGIARCRQGVAASPDPVNAALAKGRLGAALLEKGEAAEAVSLLEGAVGETARFRFAQLEGLFTALLAEARLLVGDPARAGAAAERAVTLARDSGYPYGLGWAQRVRAHVARAAGEPARAAAHLEAALAVFEAIAARFEAARTELELAELAQQQGDLAAASARVERVERVMAAAGVRRYEARIGRLREALSAAGAVLVATARPA